MEAKRAKERAWRVLPTTWRSWEWKSRRPSETNRMGFDSSKLDPSAAATRTRRRRRREEREVRLAMCVSLQELWGTTGTERGERKSERR